MPDGNAGKTPSVEDSVQGAGNVMSKKETQRRAEVEFETWKIANTAREGIQVPMSQTARDETQVPVRRSHFDEEEYQGHEEDIVNILKEDRQHMCG